MDNELGDLQSTLNQLNKSDFQNKLKEVTEDEEFMEKLASELSNNRGTLEISTKLKNDSRVTQFLRSHPEVNRKQAKNFKKQINRINYEKQLKMVKVEGVLINPGKKVKPISVELKEDLPNKHDIASRLLTDNLQIMEVQHLVAYYDANSKCKNKRACIVFKDIPGNSIIVLAKQGNLSVEDYLSFESSYR